MSKAYRIYTLKPTTEADLTTLPDGEQVSVNYATWEFIGEISAPTARVAADFIKNKQPISHIVGWETEDYKDAIEDFCSDKHGTVEDLGEGSDFIALAVLHDLAEGRDAFYVHRADLVLGPQEAIIFFGKPDADLDFHSCQAIEEALNESMPDGDPSGW